MLRRLFWSFLAACVGAFSAFVLALCLYGTRSLHGIFQSMILIILLFTAYAWLVFILPLTLWFKEDSNIYRFQYSIPLGIFLSIVAFSLYIVGIDLFMHRPSTLMMVFLSGRSSLILLFPTLFGTCAATALSILARHIRKSRTSSCS